MRIIPAVGNRESNLGPVFWPFVNSDQYSFQIRYVRWIFSAFSGQNIVTKKNLKFILTLYYKLSPNRYQKQINRSCEIKQYTKFAILYCICENRYGEYSDRVSNIYCWYLQCSIWPRGLVVNASDFGTSGTWSIPKWAPIIYFSSSFFSFIIVTCFLQVIWIDIKDEKYTP